MFDSRCGKEQVCWVPCISFWVLELCQFVPVRCACASKWKEPGQCVCVCGSYFTDPHTCDTILYLNVVNFLTICKLRTMCASQNLLNWASLWCHTCKKREQWQPAFRGGACDSDGTLGLSLQSHSHHTPIEFSLLSQAIHRDLSNSKKKKKRRGEIRKDQARKKRESAEERSRGVLLLPRALVSSPGFEKAPLMKSADVERRYDSKWVWAENKNGKQPLPPLCVFTSTLALSLSYNLSSACVLNTTAEAWCCWEERCHTAPGRCSGQCWTGTPLWVGCRGSGAHVTEAELVSGCWRVEWLMRTSRCFNQTAKRRLSCGCWLLRILQREVSTKYPTAVVKALLWKHWSFVCLKIFVAVKFVRLSFMEHLSPINKQQALFPLINHLDLLCMPGGVWLNIWHSKPRPFLLAVPLSAACVLHKFSFVLWHFLFTWCP